MKNVSISAVNSNIFKSPPASPHPPVADPGFTRGGAKPWGCQHTILPFFSPKTEWVGGGARPSRFLDPSFYCKCICNRIPVNDLVPFWLFPHHLKYQPVPLGAEPPGHNNDTGTIFLAAVNFLSVIQKYIVCVWAKVPYILLLHNS